MNTPNTVHTGGDDEEVPAAFSESLYDKLKQLGETVEYYNYPGVITIFPHQILSWQYKDQ